MINIEHMVKIKISRASVFGHRSSVSSIKGAKATGIIAYN